MKISDFKRVVQEEKSVPQPLSKAEGTPVVTSPTVSGVTDSFRIKDTFDKLTKQQPQGVVVESTPVPDVQIKNQTPFDAEKVVNGFKKYIIEHHPETMVELALKTHDPIVKKEQITILVDNQLQLEKLETIKSHLLSFLMRTLNHGAIVLEVQLFDTGKTTEKKRLFTATEKFEHFVQLNPVVLELKQVFGLELE